MFDALSELQKYQKIKLDGQTDRTPAASPYTAVLTRMAEDFHKTAKRQFKLEQQFDAYSEDILELFRGEVAKQNQAMVTQSQTILSLNRQIESYATQNIHLAWGLIQMGDALDLIATTIKAAGRTEWVDQMEQLITSATRIMNENGLQFLGGEAYFDEQRHKAVGTAIVPEKAYKAIVTVEQKGYAYLGQVLRKARVIVNTARKDESIYE
jgi:molecular chaperone GrpE (heat shock protein)